MFSFKKSLIHTPKDNDLKERLFFHDVINHTHGLILFLSQKELSGENMETSEMKMILSEIKTLQSLIRDHYKFKHKNLVQTTEWTPFSYAKLAFNNLSQTYLGNKEVEMTYKTSGEASEENLLHYPSFYRILNNLIKNISESNSTRVEFFFELKAEGLFIESRNKTTIKNEKNLPEYLSQVILSEHNVKIEGLGLESIHHLAYENGGSFTFEISDHVWINRLFLPTRKTESYLKSDKIPA